MSHLGKYKVEWCIQLHKTAGTPQIQLSIRTWKTKLKRLYKLLHWKIKTVTPTSDGQTPSTEELPSICVTSRNSSLQTSATDRSVAIPHYFLFNKFSTL